MTPRADFACLSRKCRSETEGAAPIYELPVGATRCPACGSKRLQRLWNRAAAHLRGAQPEPGNLRSSSMATNLDRLAAPEIERMEHRESAAKDARTSGGVGEGFAVRLRQTPATLAKFGARAQAGQVPGGAANVPPGEFAPVQGQMT